MLHKIKQQQTLNDPYVIPYRLLFQLSPLHDQMTAYYFMPLYKKKVQMPAVS